MAAFTMNTSVGEVMTSPALAGFQQYLIYSNPAAGAGAQGGEQNQMGLAPIAFLGQIGWSPEGVVNGLNFLAERIAAGKTQMIPLYAEAEIGENEQQKKMACLYRIMPDQQASDMESIVIASGGAYTNVCALAEGIPTARHFVEAGCQVFLLTYRVGEPMAAVHALEDMAAAVSLLSARREELSVDPERLVFCGFSAGANLVSNWGSPVIGYKAFGLPKPRAMFPVYTYIRIAEEAARDENGGLVQLMFGPDYRDYIEKYDVSRQITAEYPPCYIVCGEDDTTVPCGNSALLKEKLDACGVPAVLEKQPHAQHGFGDGTGTDAEGWPERALAFLCSL